MTDGCSKDIILNYMQALEEWPHSIHKLSNMITLCVDLTNLVNPPGISHHQRWVCIPTESWTEYHYAQFIVLFLYTVYDSSFSPNHRKAISYFGPDEERRSFNFVFERSSKDLKELHLKCKSLGIHLSKIILGWEKMDAKMITAELNQRYIRWMSSLCRSTDQKNTYIKYCLSLTKNGNMEDIGINLANLMGLHPVIAHIFCGKYRIIIKSL